MGRHSACPECGSTRVCDKNAAGFIAQVRADDDPPKTPWRTRAASALRRVDEVFRRAGS